jgi:hypothetical protein
MTDREEAPFRLRPLPILLVIALGVLYAYWFEWSGSVVAPILGHNASDVVEYLITVGLIAAWS